MPYCTVLRGNETISGRLRLDGSKSISNRALIIQALCTEGIQLNNISTSDDTRVLANALLTKAATLDVGAAGTSMRFLTAYLATQPGEWLLTGSERMKQRPIAPLVSALQQLGANITYTEQIGFPPLRIIGQNLQGGRVQMAANISSQFLSALLLIAPALKQGLQLELTTPLVSEPYLTMTLKLMQYFGIRYQQNSSVISIAPQKYEAKELFVEADWSAASYYYALAAFAKQATIELQGLFANSLQGDSVLQELMQPLGVQTEFTPDGIILHKTSAHLPDSFTYDFLECPDIAQTLAVICAGLQVPAHFEGLSTLQIKETDRTAALQQELAKVNALFTGAGNSWQLNFANLPQNLSLSPLFSTYHDHRMAMAFATLAQILPQGVQIQNPNVVSKSYPLFWQHLSDLGFHILFHD